MLRLLFCLALLAPAAARAQTEASGPLTVCRLPADAPEAVEAPGRRGARSLPAACPANERTARFEVEYDGFPADARAAFQAAVDVWACRIVASQPIRIKATWTPLGATTLGTAGPFLFRNFDGAPRRDTWYPAALASTFAGRDLAPGSPDIQGSFNSAFPAWHLDPATPPPADRYDLATVVLHEIAHGLGFIGAMAVQNGLGYVGAPGQTRGPYAYDRYTETGDGTPLLDAAAFPDGSTALSAALRSQSVWFDGPAVRQATGTRAQLYAPPAWNDGTSYTHFDEASFAPGTPDGLLTPFLVRGERIEEPGTALCAVLADVGWMLAGDCAARVGERPRQSADVVVERTGPNPFARATSLRVTSGAGGTLRAALYDAAGRRVAVLMEREVGAEEAAVLDVRAARLAAGVYFVHVRVGEAERVVPLVVAR